MEKEFMESIPGTVHVNDGTQDVRVDDDENVFSLSTYDLIQYLKNSPEFYKSQTEETMKMVLTKFLAECIYELKSDFEWYIDWAMPLFLATELNTFEDCPDAAKCKEAERFCIECECGATKFKVKSGCSHCDGCVWRE